MSDLLNSILDDGIDPRYAAAGDVLVKIAEDEGVDLDDYSDEQIGGMLSEIVDDEGDEGDYGGGPDGSGEAGEGGEGEGGGEGEVKESGDVTYAVVARELSKIAAFEGVDLTSLNQSEYNEVYNDLANAMVEPGYFQKQAAATEKLAEADAIGRAMAHSFDDELHKLAGDKEAASARQMYSAARGMGRGRARSAALAAGETARKAGRSIKGMESRGSKRVGEALRGNSKRRAARSAEGHGRLADRLKQYKRAKPAEEAAARSLGRKAAVGAAAAGTAAAGGAAYKMSFDEDVMSTARSLLADAGIDPDTGNKVASDYDETVFSNAIALLEESGYTFD